MRVGALEVVTLLDAEGSFARMSEAFPSSSSNEPWWMPINAVLVRGDGISILLDTGLGPTPRTFMPDAEVHLPEQLVDAGAQPDAVATRRRVLMELAEEGAPVAVSHFPGFGRFVREGDSFGWQPAKEESAPVE